MPGFLDLSTDQEYIPGPGNVSGAQHSVFCVENDVRVYVCGRDITKWVSNVSTRLAPLQNGGNSSTIVIKNVNNVFTIKKRDLKGIVQPDSPDAQLYSEALKRDILQNKLKIQVAKSPNGKTMRDICQDAVNSAIGKSRVVMVPELFHIFPENPDSSDWQDTRFDLALGMPVFSAGDPITIFYRHPYRYNITDTSAEPVWYRAFTGYVRMVSLSDDISTGISVITLNCEGAATRLLRLARVTTNISIYEDVLDNTEFAMGDILLTEGLTSMFTDLSLPQLLGILVIGNSPELNKYGPSPITGGAASVRGIGRFTLGSGNGGIQIFDKNKLQAWQDAIHPELTYADVVRIGESSGFGPEGEVTSSVGGFSGDYAPDRGHLHILLPDQAIENYNRIVEKSIADVGAWQSEFETRLDIIKKYVADYLYYQVLETPSGDVVAEFPFFDMTPYDLGDYGRTSLVHDAGGTSVTVTESDDLAYTWIVANGSLTNVRVPGSAEVEQIIRKAHGILSNMLPRFGIRVLQVSNPLLRSEEALTYFVKLMAARAVSDIRSASVSMAILDPAVLPNRPYIVTYKALLGNIVSVETNIGYMSEATMSVDLNYIRMITATKDGGFKFRLIGSSEATKPLQYGKLTESDELDAVSQEVDNTSETTPEPSQQDISDGHPEQASPSPAPSKSGPPSPPANDFSPSPGIKITPYR